MWNYPNLIQQIAIAKKVSNIRANLLEGIDIYQKQT